MFLITENYIPCIHIHIVYNFLKILWQTCILIIHIKWKLHIFYWNWCKKKLITNDVHKFLWTKLVTNLTSAPIFQNNLWILRFLQRTCVMFGDESFLLTCVQHKYSREQDTKTNSQQNKVKKSVKKNYVWELKICTASHSTV